MFRYAGLVRLGMASAGSWRCHKRSDAVLDFKGVFVNVRVFKFLLFGSVAWLTLSAAWLAVGLGASSSESQSVGHRTSAVVLGHCGSGGACVRNLGCGVHARQEARRSAERCESGPGKVGAGNWARRSHHVWQSASLWCAGSAGECADSGAELQGGQARTASAGVAGGILGRLHWSFIRSAGG